MGNQYSRRAIEWEVTNNGCWVCTSHKKNKRGYYNMMIKGQPMLLHRFIYEELFGFIGKDLVVRHKCDNPSCINPEHLEIGTQKDNMRDRQLRGRTAITSGEKSGKAKLTWEQVRAIRRDNKSLSQIAKQYGVHKSTIAGIKQGKTWRESYAN